MSEPSSEHRSLSLEQKVISSGIDPEPFFSRLGLALRTVPDPHRARTNLDRFLESGFTSSLLHDFVAHPVLLDVFLELSGQSQYIADILIRNPELLRWLTTTGELQRVKSHDDLLKEANASASAFEQIARKKDALRRFHRREILRIGASDILNEATLEAVVAQLSALADVLIDMALRLSHEELQRTVGVSFRHDLAAIGLGKLGGGELNFSSDIDLLFVYAADRTYRKPLGRMHSSFELHIRLAEMAVLFLSEFTAEGHLYRVDMRLRPDGRSGPLALSHAASLTYYESRGEAWERQMLIKARVVGGRRSVGTKLLLALRPFVFPRTVLSAPWANIASMKQAIEREFHSPGNIKLGAGGIRDIEFLVQGMQLLHGGSVKALQTGQTLGALRVLQQERLMDADDVTMLIDAYALYRRVEHRLQLLHGLQTHELPETHEEFSMLGRKLGYRSTEAFRDALDGRRRAVRLRFLSAVDGGTPVVKDGLTDEEQASLGALSGTMREETFHALLKDIRSAALPALAARRVSHLFAASSNQSTLAHAFTSERFRQDMLKAIVYSSVLSERLSSDPLLLESLAGQAPVLLGQPDLGWEELLESHAATYTSYNQTRSAIRFLSGRTDISGLERELTALASSVVEQAAVRTLPSEGMNIIAAGKLGSGEVSISSDVDLLVFFDEGCLEPAKAEASARAFLAELSASGKTYDVDFRLRPEGRNAPLAVTLGYFKDYVARRAQIWERMAFTRCRSIWGDPRIGRSFARFLKRSSGPSMADLAGAMTSMRRRMEEERLTREGIDLKLGPGGIVDIEFIAQAGSLLRGVGKSPHTKTVIDALAADGLLHKREAHLLSEGLTFLRTVEALVRLNNVSGGSLFRESDQMSALLLSFLTREKDTVASGVILQKMHTIREQFTKITSRWEKGGG